MWPFRRKPRVLKRTLEFKTTPEETLKLCQLWDAMNAALMIWDSARALSKKRFNDPIWHAQGPEECRFLYIREIQRLCRQRVAEDEKTSSPWPPMFGYTAKREGNTFCIRVEGES